MSATTDKKAGQVRFYLDKKAGQVRFYLCLFQPNSHFPSVFAASNSDDDYFVFTGKKSGTGTVLWECVNRGRAMGEAAWMERVVKKPDLQTQVKPYLSRFLACPSKTVPVPLSCPIRFSCSVMGEAADI